MHCVYYGSTVTTIAYCSNDYKNAHSRPMTTARIIESTTTIKLTTRLSELANELYDASRL